jgi:glycosidase
MNFAFYAIRKTDNTIFYFHVKKSARDKYNFDENLYSIRGNLVIISSHQARILSEKINSVRRTEGKIEQLITPGQINALGILHEIFHFLIRYYEQDINPGVFNRALETLKSNLSEEEIDKLLIKFIEFYPPKSVYTGEIKAQDFLRAKTGNKSNHEIILEELILLHLENINPATLLLEEFYNDFELKEQTKYSEVLDLTEKFFENEIPIGDDNLPLISFLRKPITFNPYNIEAQLDFIRENWNVFIPGELLKKLLTGKDLIYEDAKLFIQHGGGEKGTPPVPVYEFDKEYFEMLKKKLAAGGKLSAEENQFYYAETEQFTQDIDWMPRVVMLAKNVFVWMDQLSKKYHRPIKKLNEIPDEELDTISRWNFTALWLIGIWERSTPSKKIKQIMGNPDAASSAYSLYDYVIAQELGGEEAFENLKHRAWQRGIRMASDMVPNHTGIYSKWIIEKPEYFIQRDYPPYPGYTFSGPDLSDDSRVQLRIEDKYYNRSDAAVVFQRVDSYSGKLTYIYHGNDGTNMPWNDTAQLNLLNPEVRESLIQTIMHVARKTPIIRFDAAMTLTKKHYQRLWFPQPGSGGAIPSRSDYSLTRSEFDRAMPNEFWREVVDRMNSEMPATLLLAEAFWLMEGYFVRTLGMHRVYNSAFMHMLMKEENEKYKLLIKNTLEFNPEILKRYVNFMSNPDEETAINQFGKGDKYFGVAVLMITLPGLPMFGHGQVEGFSEKYGMEYKRAYYDEYVDDNLVRRHESELFPLMKKRHLFSQVVNFDLYDFYELNGTLNENVFAYTNRSGNEKALILYNNSYTECSGTINYSVLKVINTENPDKPLGKVKVAEALQFKNDGRFFYKYKDHKTRLEFLVNGSEIHEHGFAIFLKGYEYRLCVDFVELYDFEGKYQRLQNYLGGRGVYSIDIALRELELAPFHQALFDLFSPDLLSEIKSQIYRIEKAGSSLNKMSQVTEKDLMTEGNNQEFRISELFSNNFEKVIQELNKQLSIDLNTSAAIEKTKQKFTRISEIFRVIDKEQSRKINSKWISELNSYLFFNNSHSLKTFNDLLLIYIILESIFYDSTYGIGSPAEVFDNLILPKAILETLERNEHNLNDLWKEIHLLKILLNDLTQLLNADQDNGNKIDLSLNSIVISLLKSNETISFLLLNHFENKIYFNKERFEEILAWIFNLNTLKVFDFDRNAVKDKLKNKAEAVSNKKPADNFTKKLRRDLEILILMKNLAEKNNFVLEEFISSIKELKSKPIAKKVTKKKS